MALSEFEASPGSLLTATRSRTPLLVGICFVVLVVVGIVVFKALTGPSWTLNGHQVPASVVDTQAGPAHCGWGSATFLTLGWPLGTHAQSGAQSRQYIRDPNGVIPTTGLRSRFGLNAELPPDARPTGYQDGNTKLYLAPSDEGNVVYLVNGTSIERWPRSDPMTLCS